MRTVTDLLHNYTSQVVTYKCSMAARNMLPAEAYPARDQLALPEPVAAICHDAHQL